ncbi:MAG: restriction endonuclease [Chloroflexi bacterium]|nr:restriction endonuclease [Chloroflexota bacterium]
METNVIYCGDCLIKLKEIPDESIDLIYIDPPFSSNRNYVAFWQEQEKRRFEDRFENVPVYLDYMRPRVKELYRVLKPTGSFYYHCDWHASHYIKVMLDRDDLFGYGNFRNEIIWQRTSAGKPIYRNLPQNTDSILWYTKSNNYCFQPVLQPLSEQDIATFNLDDSDGRGKYNTQPIINPAYRPHLRYVYKDLRGKEWQPPKNGWRFNENRMRELEKDNRLHFTKRTIREKYYLSERLAKGKQVSNIWIDIPIVAKQEFLGYPTQKPIALLDRIVKASSNEGDIVLDAFCGCGTTLVVAQRLKRKWIGIDISPTACRVVAKRLQDSCGIKEGVDFWIRDLPKTVEELRAYPAFEFQNWAVNALGGVPNKIKVRDKGIDGKLYPIEDIKKEKKEGLDLFGDIDRYIPIQVKGTDQVGRPAIENFEVAMKRDKREKGIFIGFDFSRDALQEIRRAEREEGLLIEPKTVSQIVEDQLDKSLL